MVVALEETAIFDQVGITPPKLWPIATRIDGATFGDQQQEEPGDRCMVFARDAQLQRQAPQSRIEPRQRLGQLELLEIQPRQIYVGLVIEGVRVDLAAFEGPDAESHRASCVHTETSSSLCESAAVSVQP